jgi:hypothetical protein
MGITHGNCLRAWARVSAFPVMLLIDGETGTIHAAGDRRGQRYAAVVSRVAGVST